MGPATSSLREENRLAGIPFKKRSIAAALFALLRHEKGHLGSKKIPKMLSVPR